MLAINEEGQERANLTAAALNDLPLLQDVDADNDNDSDAWEDWGATWRDVRIVDANGELSGVLNLTRNDLGEPANYANLRDMIVEAATANRVATSPWQNRIEPMDVNNDGNVVPRDVLAIINHLNTEGAGELEAPSGEPDNYLDVTGDNHVSALDALRIIQVLNRLNNASGEPENVPAPTPPQSGVDAYFALTLHQSDDDE